MSYFIALITGSQLVIGLLAVGLARAQGWRIMRSTALVAFSACAYCLTGMGYALPHPSATLLILVNAASWLCAAGVLLGWMWRVRYDEESGTLVTHRGDRWLVAGLLLSLSVNATPHVGFSPTIHIHQVLGQAYSEFELTWLGLGATALAAVIFLHVVWCYVVAVRARTSSAAWVYLLSMGLVVLSSLNDLLLISGVLRGGVFLFQFSLIGVTVATLVDVVQRAVRDAEAMKTLSTSLQREVAQQTQNLLGVHQALLRTERLASLGQLAAGVGHEINNPLTYIKSNLDYIDEELRQGDAAPELLRALAEAKEGTERIRRVVSDLRGHVREEPDGVAARVLLKDVIDSSIKLVNHQYHDRAIFEVEVDGEPACAATSGRLEQVVVNLLINAVHATPDSSADRATIRVRAFIDREARRCHLEVIDRGCGIAPENVPRVFEPFFTTKPMDQGTGLGLYIANSIVTEMSGTLELDSEVGRGTTVRIELPWAAPSEPSALRAPTQPLGAVEPDPTRAAARPRVLIIDDDELVGRALRRILRSYDVVVEQDGPSALARLRDDARYDAILCDLSMSPLSGIEVFERISELDAGLARRMVFITGGALSERGREFLERPDIVWLPKPLDPSQLTQAIDACASPARPTADLTPAAPKRRAGPVHAS